MCIELELKNGVLVAKVGKKDAKKKDAHEITAMSMLTSPVMASHDGEVREREKERNTRY
jgi:hypothetical protein